MTAHAMQGTQDVESAFRTIFDRAVQRQPQIEHIILASDQGLVVAFKSRTKGKEHRIAALAPVLEDAGNLVFSELGLMPLGEVMLLGSEGTAYLTRLKSSPASLLLAAKGQVNVGLLRMVAGEIEAEASELLRAFMR